MFSINEHAHVFPQTSWMLHVKTCLLLHMMIQMTITQPPLNFTSTSCPSLLRALQGSSQFASHPRTCDMACFLFDTFTVHTSFHRTTSTIVTIARPGKKFDGCPLHLNSSLFEHSGLLFRISLISLQVLPISLRKLLCLFTNAFVSCFSSFTLNNCFSLSFFSTRTSDLISL